MAKKFICLEKKKKDFYAWNNPSAMKLQILVNMKEDHFIVCMWETL